MTTTTTLECPPNKVPGWLDEHGNPQGCVDNNPTPLQPKPEIPVEETPTAPISPAPAPAPVEELAQPMPPAYIETAAPGDTIAEVGTTTPAHVEELALTGAGDIAVWGLAIALVVAGISIAFRGRIISKATR